MRVVVLTLTWPDPVPTSSTTQYFSDASRLIALVALNTARPGRSRSVDPIVGVFSVPPVTAVAAGEPELSAWIATRGVAPDSAATPRTTEVSSRPPM